MRFFRREPEPEKEWTIYEHEELYFLISPHGHLVGGGRETRSAAESDRDSLNQTYRAQVAYEREQE